jgi:DNA-binding response OmpR family regulator
LSSAAQVVFIANGESESARSLAHQVEAAGFAARSYREMAALVRDAELAPPSIFLLGLSLADGSGIELCHRLRRLPQFARIPIIFVARGSDSERVLGLEAGADDYLAQPFGPRELVARLNAVLRRYRPADQSDELRVGPLVIDRLGMTVTLRGDAVELTVTEFRLLEHLARNPGRVLSRDQLLGVLWRGSHSATPRAIDVYIRRIRSKIERDPENPEYLITVRGTGYRLSPSNLREMEDLGA